MDGLVQQNPRYETSCIFLDRLRAKQRTAPDTQKTIVQAAWSVSVFIIMANVKTCEPIRKMKKTIWITLTSSRPAAPKRTSAASAMLCTWG